MRRRALLLVQLLADADAGIRLNEHIRTSTAVAFRQVCVMGLEGMVAKAAQQPLPLGRCREWIKVEKPDGPAAARIFEF